MKIFSTIFLCGLFSLIVSAQANAYRDFIIAASSKTNPVILVENFKEVGGSSRFFSDDWCDGYVTPNYGASTSHGTKFNYDYDEKTLYLKSSSKEIIAINMQSVKNFGIVSEKGEMHHFAKIKGIDIDTLNFYEIIGGSDSSSIAIFKTKIIELRKADKNDYLNNFNGDYSSTYLSKTEYILYDSAKGTKKTKSINKKELLAFYPDHKNKILLDFKKKNKLSDQEAKLLIDGILNLPSN